MSSPTAAKVDCGVQTSPPPVAQICYIRPSRVKNTCQRELPGPERDLLDKLARYKRSHMAAVKEIAEKYEPRKQLTVVGDDAGPALPASLNTYLPCDTPTNALQAFTQRLYMHSIPEQCMALWEFQYGPLPACLVVHLDAPFTLVIDSSTNPDPFATQLSEPQPPLSPEPRMMLMSYSQFCRIVGRFPARQEYHFESLFALRNELLTTVLDQATQIYAQLGVGQTPTMRRRAVAVALNTLLEKISHLDSARLILPWDDHLTNCPFIPFHPEDNESMTSVEALRWVARYDPERDVTYMPVSVQDWLVKCLYENILSNADTALGGFFSASVDDGHIPVLLTPSAGEDERTTCYVFEWESNAQPTPTNYTSGSESGESAGKGAADGLGDSDGDGSESGCVL